MSKVDSRNLDFRALKVAVTIEQILHHYGILDSFKRGPDSLSGPCPIHRAIQMEPLHEAICRLHRFHVFQARDEIEYVPAAVAVPEAIPAILAERNSELSGIGALMAQKSPGRTTSPSYKESAAMGHCRQR